MKLYYFNPNDYSTQAMVCAESVEDAKQALLKTLRPVKESKKSGIENLLAELHNEGIHDMVNLKRGYTLEVLEPNTVLFAEIS